MRKVYLMVMAKKEGLRLIIDLSPDEAEVFRRLAKTDDEALYEGIVRSLLLGAGRVVDPRDVDHHIELLVQMSEYGRRGDLRAQQEWADELSFTRDQLEEQPVKDAICSWAVYFGEDISALSTGRSISHLDQVRWVSFDATSSALLGTLRSTIRKSVKTT